MGRRWLDAVLVCAVISFSAPTLASVEAEPCAPTIVEELLKPITFKAWVNQNVSEAPRIKPLSNPAIEIVGLGPGGISLAIALKKEGIAFHILEKGLGAGGLWNPRGFGTPLYPGLVMNSSTVTSVLSREHTKYKKPTYLTAAEAHLYLTDVASFLSSEEVSYLMGLESLEENASEESLLAKVRSYSCGKMEEAKFSSVCLATGHHNRKKAYVPQTLFDQARSNVLYVNHGSHFVDLDFFRKKRVAVIGSGNTAADHSVLFSEAGAEDVLMVARSTPWIVPRWVFPGTPFEKPADAFYRESPKKLPHSISMVAFKLLQDLHVGHPKKLGFPLAPSHRIMDRLPVTDRGFSRALKEGRVRIGMGLKGFSRGTIHYGIGQEIEEKVDVVIFDTGFKREFPELSQSQRDALINKEPSLLIFHPDDDRIFLMNEVSVPQSSWPMFTAQAKAVAAYVKARQEGRPNVQRFAAIRRFGKNPSFKGQIFKEEDAYFVDPFVYETFLEQFSNWILE